MTIFRMLNRLFLPFGISILPLAMQWRAETFQIDLKIIQMLKKSDVILT